MDSASIRPRQAGVSRLTCETCEAETPVVQRIIGFFGLREIYSRWCRPCLRVAAADAGLDVEAVVKEFDDLVQGCIESREGYRRQKEERGRNRGAGP